MSAHTTHRSVSASAHTTHSLAILAPPAALVAIAVSLACALTGATPALAAAGEGCPNEHVRAESNVNPTTGQPYSQGLPECRAYEMVSPLDKQAHYAFGPGYIPAIPVSPDGSAIGWNSVGAYADPSNYGLAFGPNNPYLAQRAPAGWITRSGFAPASLVLHPGNLDIDPSWGVFSPDLSIEVSCGSNAQASGVACALRDPDGSWLGTPSYATVSGAEVVAPFILGASSELSDVVFQPDREGEHFLPADTSQAGCGNGPVVCDGLYEIAGNGTASPELQLVDVDNSGNMIGPESPTGIGALAGSQGGTSYQAMSADGSRIYFTATPNAGNDFGLSTNVQTVFARVDGTATVDISNPSPSQCTRCTREAEEGKPETSEAQPATFQGASADGSKVFFTTSQQLVNADTDATSDLYEYDFDKPVGQRLVQITGGGAGDLTPGAGANGGGTVSISEDGLHVYFVADGVLTTLPNGVGQTAIPGTPNLYGFDTETDQTKFVATLSPLDGTLIGERTGGSGVGSAHLDRLAQTTPDGRYLVFDSYAKLISAGPEADTSGAQQVYRYDFDTGELNRVSIGHEGFDDNGNAPGMNSLIAPKPISEAGEEGGSGALPTINDINRAISDDGADVVFMTAQQLQGDDPDRGNTASCDAFSSTPDEAASSAGCAVYLWHECAGGRCADGESGVTNLISDGNGPAEDGFAVISGSGSDIFFETSSELVGQDSDELGDIYDARIDGGFPAPAPEPSCSGEACQPGPSAPPSFGSTGTSSFTGQGNIAPGSTAFPTPQSATPKPSTRAEQLANALKACGRDKPKARRETCETRARKRYGTKRKPKTT